MHLQSPNEIIIAAFIIELPLSVLFFFCFLLKIHVCFLSASLIEAHLLSVGAQGLSGRVLDSRPKDRGFEPHRGHCVVVLEQDTFILAKHWFNP